MTELDWIDLGWTQRPKGWSIAATAQESSGPIDDESFAHILGGYRHVPSLIDGISVGRYRLKSDWYISEVEDALRVGLVLFDKVAIELPVSSLGCVEDGTWFGEGVSCDVSFLAPGALVDLANHFGDAVAGNELILLPNFQLHWSEGEDGGAPSSMYAVEEVLGPVSRVWSSLSKGSGFELSDLDGDVRTSMRVHLPRLAGGDARDVVRLRRDEADAFRRWRDYLDETQRSSSLTQEQLREAIEQGLAELDNRLAVLRRRGLLDAIGAVAFASSYGVAVGGGGTAAITSGAIGLAGVAAMGLKAYIEANEGSSQLRQDPRYFYWAVQCSGGSAA